MLLTVQVRPGINLKIGRSGVDLWRVLVLAILKQGLGCDYDRLQELTNWRQTLREMLGHSDRLLRRADESLSVANADRQCVACSDRSCQPPVSDQRRLRRGVDAYSAARQPDAVVRLRISWI